MSCDHLTTTAKYSSIAAASYEFAASSIPTILALDGSESVFSSREFSTKFMETPSFMVKRDGYALYKYDLSRPGNVIFLATFLVIASFNIFMAFRSKQTWYNVSFCVGYGLEVIGYLGRVLGFINNEITGYYVMQSLCLTVAPAFIMAGIYFLFAQNVAVHGRQYSLLKPMWYSYFFITIDVVSIFVQGGGGGLVSAGDETMQNLGNIIMFIGILVQIIAITIFLFFWFIFLGRTFFHDRDSVPEHCSYRKKSVLNYIKLLLNVPSARAYKLEYLDRFYNPKYQSIRLRNLYSYYPLAVSVAVVLIYIRCLFRVVELKMGFDGYLMQHEVYLFVLDSLMIAITGLVFIPFHPVFVFGRDNVLTKKDIKSCGYSTPQEFVFQETSADGEKGFALAAERHAEVSLRTSL